MSFGLTDTGITVQTVDEILTELQTAARAPSGGIHPNLDVSATSVFGQLFGIWAEREYLIQQAVLAVWASFGSSATGQSLANIALLTGTIKAGPTYSTVTATVTLDAGTTLPAGSRANVNGDTTAIFETLVDVVNGGPSSNDFSVDMQAISTGAVRASSGTLTVINTPVSGWTAVTNASDATLGEDTETDPALRTRRVEELRVSGSTILAAIEADVASVAGVIDVKGYENTSLITDADGVPGKAFEVVVWDGDTPAAVDDDIAQAIFDAAPAGIEAAHGTAGSAESGDAVDSEGATHTIDFTRADALTLYITFTITTDANYPADGDTQVKAAVADLLDSILGIGDDVIVGKLYAPVYSITGVVDVTTIELGFSVSPSGTANLSVGSREIALADTSRIVVNS